MNSRWTVQLSGGQLVSCSKDKTLRFWNINTGVTEKVLTGHTDYVRCLLLLNDDRVVSGSDDNTMRIWG
jgi:WD40 repeat protein